MDDEETLTRGVYPDGSPRCIFTVSDTGSGVNSVNDVFFKYHQSQTPGEGDALDLESVQNARDRQARAVSSIHATI